MVDFPTRIKFAYVVDFTTLVEFLTGRKNLSYLSYLHGLLRSNVYFWVDYLIVFHIDLQGSTTNAYFSFYNFFSDIDQYICFPP